MDTPFHASENDFICEDCGKCLKSRNGLINIHLPFTVTFKFFVALLP